MSEPPRLPNTSCLRCGATNPPHATKCWLCDRSGAVNPYATEPQVQTLDASACGRGANAPASAQHRVQTIFTSLLIGAVILALIIAVGLGAQEPGLLVPYFILIGPPFLATGARALYSVSLNEKPKPSTLFLTFIWSGLFTVMLTVAAVIALFVMCINAFQ